MGCKLAVLYCVVNIVLLATLICALVEACGRHRRHLRNVALSTLHPLLVGGVNEVLGLALFFFVLCLIALTVVVKLIMLAPFALVVAVPLLVTYNVPVKLFTTVCLFRGIDVMATFRGAFHLKFTA